VTLAREVRDKLVATVRARPSPQRAVLRARIVLLAAEGWGVAPTSRHLQVTVSTVRKWRGRFATSGLDGLLDRRRSGRPCRFDGLVRSALFSLACRPVPEDLYRNHWTTDELRRELLAADLVSNISVASVARLLADADLRPYRFRMWVHSPDPQFREKVAELCALYTRPVGPNQVVVCIDEKTGMQALRRRFPGCRPGPAQIGRWEFEYRRQGTRCLTAAFNVHTADVFGHVTRRRTKQDLLAYLEALARHYPTQTVHVVWDNLNTHHGEHIVEFNQRHGGRFHFHYTPIHASWCNQVELWFSLLTRRVLRHGDFRDVHDLERRVLGFIAVWNRHERQPFRWTFTGYPLQTGLTHAKSHRHIVRGQSTGRIARAA
jgi:transposase